jgi:hypothetical protein
VLQASASGEPERQRAACLQAAFPNLVLVHTPIHASWLNQIEIYFSIVQRKVLVPNDIGIRARRSAKNP